MSTAQRPSPPAVEVTPEMRRRWLEEHCRAEGMPLPEEIAAECEAIRAGWDAITEFSRRGVAWAYFHDEPVPAAHPFGAAIRSTVRRRNGRIMAGRR